MARKNPNWGPKTVKLFEVNIYSGNIKEYMTSKTEAMFDVANGNVFKTRKAAQKYVNEWLKTAKNVLVDTTEWTDEDEQEAIENGEPDYVDENGVPHYNVDNIISIHGIIDSVVAPPFPDHISLKTAELIALGYASKQIKDVNKYVLTKVSDKEIDAVDAFLTWFHNDYQGLAPKMNKANICKLYKQFLETV